MLELLTTLSEIGALGASCQPEHVEHLAEHVFLTPKSLKNNDEHAEHVEHARNGVPAIEAPDTWRALLDQLGDRSAPAGYSPERWVALVADAQWIARSHGDSAAAFGWTASDLFGLDPDRVGWGDSPT